MTWWRRLWHGRELEDQLDKELRFYLDQHTADLIMRGFSPQEARRRAWLALGGPEQVKESCRDARGTRWVEDLRLDGKYALRTLRQKPGFAAAALLTFSLGIGSTTVMFTILDGVLLKPLPFPEPEKLLSVHLRNEKLGEFWGTPTPIFSNNKRLLQRLVDGMQPAEASTFAVMILALLTAAITASFVPARRASRIDPVRTLRQD